MDSKNLNKLVTEALAIELEDAKEAGALGYMARALVQATMPHKSPGLVEAWGRKNGNFSMLMQPGYVMDKNNKPCNIGLPYGTKPRLLMAFVSSEAVRTKNKEIVLGRSLSDFMRQLDLAPTGGRWGTIPILREQMKRLFSSTISFQYDGENAEIMGGFRIASQTVLFWDPKSPQQSALWESTVTLTDDFYREITEHPVPINMNALSALKSSSMAIDIYCWLTYRMSYLKRPTEIPWGLLAAQFGSDYSELRDFKKNFLKQLKKVSIIYKANINETANGLLIKPSKTHIPLISA
ncbi:MAG: replication protein RepA [Gammaproteobacteria bacterium]